MVSCAVYGCTNRSGTKSVRQRRLEMSRKKTAFHRFPSDPEKRALWVKAIKRDDNWSPSYFSRVCSAHFSEDSFLFEDGDLRGRLKDNAVPIVFHKSAKYLQGKYQSERRTKHVQNKSNHTSEKGILEGPDVNASDMQEFKDILVKKEVPVESDAAPSQVDKRHAVIKDKSSLGTGIANVACLERTSVCNIKQEFPPNASSTLPTMKPHVVVPNKQSPRKILSKEDPKVDKQPKYYFVLVPSKTEAPVVNRGVPPLISFADTSTKNSSVKQVVEGSSIVVKELPPMPQLIVRNENKPALMSNVTKMPPLCVIPKNLGSVLREVPPLTSIVKKPGAVIPIKPATTLSLAGQASISNVSVSTSLAKKIEKMPAAVQTVKKNTPISRTSQLESVKNDIHKKEIRCLKERYMKKIKTLQQRLRRYERRKQQLEQVVQHLRLKLTSKQKNGFEFLKTLGQLKEELFQRQFSKANSGKIKKQYCTELKSFAMTLFHLSPEAYAYVRKTFDSCLPHRKTICKWFSGDTKDDGQVSESSDSAEETEDVQLEALPVLDVDVSVDVDVVPNFDEDEDEEMMMNDEETELAYESIYVQSEDDDTEVS